MEIVRASPNGFCFGVRRAVQAVGAALDRGDRVFCLGPVIHHPLAVADMQARGAQIVERPEQIPPEATAVIRSHGEGPEVWAALRQRGCRIIDTTCPHVTRIHRLVEQMRQQGQPVIVAGQADHPEVQGIVAWAGQATVVANEGEAGQLVPLPNAALVVQTTFDQAVLPGLIRALEQRVETLEVHDTSCDATRQRQAQAVQLAAECQAVVVIGGKHSSNSRKLYDLALAGNANTWFAESAREIDPFSLAQFTVVGVIAGASTPDEVIEEVIQTMSEIQNTNPIAEGAEEQTPVCQDGVCTVTEVPEAAASVPDEVADAPAEAVAAEPVQEETMEASFAEQVDQIMVQLRRGQLVTGTVVQVTEDEVCVNVGYKSDGIVSRKDLTGDDSVDPREIVKVGDVIEVEVIKVNDGEGNVILSKRNIDARKAWVALADTLEAGGTFMATATELVKGGIVAFANGVRVFIPASQAAARFTKDLSPLIGKELELKVVELNRERRQIVASHRAVVEERAEAEKNELWSRIPEPGALVHSVVRRITDFGAFCDIGGIDGLLHVTDMAWGRAGNPRDIVKPGDELTVMILSVDKERGRVSLGLKQLLPKPWEVAEQKYPVGTVVEARVLRTTSFGAFVQLEPGLDGLVHISQVSKKRVENVEEAVKPGDLVKVIVLEVRPDAKRISLSIRQAMDDDEPETVAPAMDSLAGERAITSTHTDSDTDTLASAFAAAMAAAGQEVPVVEEPVVEEAPVAEEAPAEEAPVEEAPVKKPRAPRKPKVAAEEAPAEEAVAQEAPAEETPAE